MKGKNQHKVSFLGRCLSDKGVSQKRVDDSRFFFGMFQLQWAELNIKMKSYPWKLREISKNK